MFELYAYDYDFLAGQSQGEKPRHYICFLSRFVALILLLKRRFIYYANIHSDLDILLPVNEYFNIK